MNIDIKTILLDSLSTKKTIHGSRRVYFRKSCFIIRYEVKGKFLTITSIKKTSGKHSTWSNRSKRIYRIIRWYQVNVKKYLKNGNQKQLPIALRDSGEPVMTLNFTKVQTLTTDNVMLEFKETQTMESHILTKTTRTTATETENITVGCLNFSDVQTLNIDNIKRVNKQMQTMKSQIPTKTKATATETKKIPVLTSGQQTIVSPRFNLTRSLLKSSIILSKSCQTELKNESRGIQCIPQTSVGSIQTDAINVKCSSTQDWTDLLKVENSTVESTTNTSVSNLAETEVVIYMLNEIGELVLNQNHILNNNSQILAQMSEMSMLAKTVAKGNAWRSKRNPIKNKKIRSAHEKFYKIQPILKSEETCSLDTGTPPKEIFDKRHKSIQTERKNSKPEMFDKFTQTTLDFIKPRKLSFFIKQK